MTNLQNKVAAKVTKKVKYATVATVSQNKFHKEYEKFMLFKKCTPFGLCRSTITLKVTACFIAFKKLIL